MNSAYLSMLYTSGAGDGLATVLRRQRRQVARLACSGKSDYISEEVSYQTSAGHASQHTEAGSKLRRFELKTMSTRVDHTGSEDRGVWTTHVNDGSSRGKGRIDRACSPVAKEGLGHKPAQ